MRIGSTSRPLYVLQFGQTRCGRFGCLQVGQTCIRGGEIPCCARRLSRLAFDVFRFGTAMSRYGFRAGRYLRERILGSCSLSAVAEYSEALVTARARQVAGM
jgi:hypothetical protein